MRMIAGLDAPTGGQVTADGRSYGQLRFPLREAGALLDAGAAHPGRTARDHLAWLAAANQIPSSRVDQVLGIADLAGAARRRAGELSLGMSQRLGIAAALLGNPPVLIFDEPVNGLDPEGILRVRKLLQSLAAEGRTVLVSSHLRAVIGGAVHLVLIGAIAVGLGALLRRTAGAVAVLFAVLLVLPGLVTLLPAPWNNDITRYLPNSAGAAMSAVVRFPNLLSPAAGLIVLCAYTAATLTLAAVTLTRRDA